ncbi:MAG: amidohydrolase [Actinobacteria bacterium]|nr:amidohydrolase [Actinomycetota bacterium]
MSEALLIKGGCVVTMDAARRRFDPGAVLVEGSRIAAVGPSQELAAAYPGVASIEAAGALVTPGLIDAHNHPIHYLSKGLADDLELSVRSYRNIWPFEAGLTPEEAHLSSLGTFAEMIRGGTTCFVDPGSPRPHEVARAAAEIGIRGVVSREAWDLPDENAPAGLLEQTDAVLAAGEEVVERWNGAADGRLRAWLSLVRPSSVSDELCRRTKRRADELGVGIHGHLVASRTEDRDTQRVVGSGSAVPRYAELGLLGPNLCLAHLGWLEDAEIELLLEAGVKGVHCPSASMLGGFGVIAHGRFPELVEAGVPVALGSDAAAISRFLDMVRVGYLAACGHKDARIDPTVMGADCAFEMLTSGGARCVLWEDEIGSLEAGKAADLVVWDTDGLEWHPNPLANPIRNLIYSASGRSARTVLIDGNVVMRDRVIANLDLDPFLAAADAAAAAVRARLGLEVGAEGGRAAGATAG